MPEEALRIELEEASCPLCGSEEREKILQSADREEKLPGVFTLVRCRVCGVLYTSPRPAESSVGIFYPDDYEPHRGFDAGREVERALRWKGGIRGWYLRNVHTPEGVRPRGIAARLLSSLLARLGMRRRFRRLPLFREGGRLLDLGCGTGRYLCFMRALGWKAVGLEPSERAARQASRFGLDVRCGRLPGEVFPAEYFDAVTLWHVLEHLREPRSTLKEIWRILKPGGELLIGLPLSESILFRWFKEDWFCLQLPRHLIHFDRMSLRRLLEESGFQIVRVDLEARRSLMEKTLQLAARKSKFWSALKSLPGTARFLAWLSGLLRRPDTAVVRALKRKGENREKGRCGKK